ncbi:MAG: glycosyltransferase family 4 protein [Colwellia sp.]|nr:glycosyltransferase family 4 protein [Colwellia sp.]
MKVLVVANMYPTKQNPSSGVFIKKVTEKLSNSAEFDVYLWKLLGGNKHLAYMHFYLLFIIKLVIVRPDIVYCHFISHTGILGYLAKKVFGSKLVLNAHGSDIMNSIKKGNRLFKLNQYLLSHADLVVVPSQFLKNIIHSHFSIEHSKLFVSPSGGVVLSQKEKNNKITTMLKLGFVGRLIPMKGIDTITSALKNSNNIELQIAGGGDYSYIFNELKDNVKLTYYGEIPQHELENLYNEIDLLLFPTKFEESLGLTPLEAMAHFVPVIACDMGAVSEYIHHEKTGYLIPKDNAVQLSKYIENFRSMPLSEKIAMGKLAHQTAKKYEESIVHQALKNRLSSL